MTLNFKNEQFHPSENQIINEFFEDFMSHEKPSKANESDPSLNLTLHYKEDPEKNAKIEEILNEIVACSLGKQTGFKTGEFQKENRNSQV